MENILDFIQAALPWIAMGFLLAIFLPEVLQRKGRVKKGATITEQRGCVLECARVLRLNVKGLIQ